MKKKIFGLAIFAVMLFLISGCTGKDAKKFKEDYEALNGVETSTSGVYYRSITIDSDNPIVYSSFKEVSEKIESKDDFIVYVGFSACPWCRSVIPYVLESAKENKIKKIYYINVREDNTRASDLRGYYKLDENGNVVVDVQADEYYKKVLNTLDDYLSPYTLTDTNGKTVETGENRLYAPTVIVYKEGKAVALDECISDSQTNGYMDLTDEMIADIKTKADALFKKYNE